MYNKFAKNKGFTLIELLIAVTIFSMFTVGMITVVVDLYRDSRRIVLEESMYNDLRSMMRQLTNLIENNTIDYEEYYRAAVGSPNYTGVADPLPKYTYGDYGKVFFYFGMENGPGNQGIPGVFCSGDTTFSNPVTSAIECTGVGDLVNKTTFDVNVGKNPWNADDVTTMQSANAFCGGDAPACNAATNYNLQPELYLINERGDRKYILGLEEARIANAFDDDGNPIPIQENVLSMAWLNGFDDDSNGVIDTWELGDEFIVQGADPTDQEDRIVNLALDFADGGTIYDGFQPISPLKTRIRQLDFYVYPLEDPYKAFAEDDPAVQVQPHVQISITVEPAQSELEDYLGPIPTKTLTTTIFSKVKQNVPTYIE